MKNKSVESYDGDKENTEMLYGMTIGIGLVFTTVVLGLWIWALIMTINYWNILPTWAKVLAVIGLLTLQFGGPLMTLIIVYIVKNSNKSSVTKYQYRHY